MVRELSVDEMKSIYEEHLTSDFPASEVKPWKSIKSGTEDGKYFAYAMFENDSKILQAYAFFIKCSVNDFLLLDYFAVVKGKRSTGLGSMFLQELKQIAKADNRQLILEVENPEYEADSDKRNYMEKRIEFYKKNGMKLSDVSCNFMRNDYRILYADNAREELHDNLKLRQLVEIVYRDFFGDDLVDNNVVFYELPDNIIKNVTQFKKDYIKKIMWACNSDSTKYRRFKLIYNLFGLVAGMMFIRYFIFDMLGKQQSSTVLIYVYAIVAGICLYIGMYGMDRDKLKKYNKIYKNMVGIKFRYEIDDKGINILDEDEESELFDWENVIRVRQDIDNFYFFVGEEECLVVDKNGFSQGSAKQLKELADAFVKVTLS